MPSDTRFTVPDKDLRWDTFRCGGKGGQNVQKRDTGARVTHTPSGAVGQCTNQRSQHQNKVEALRRLADNRIFKAWAALQLQMMDEGYRSVEAKVDDLMRDENLRIETYAGPHDSQDPEET